MKTLYLLVSNGGDGSYSISGTFNEDWIQFQEDRYENGDSDYEYDPGVDGDGFHYTTLSLPDECTIQSIDLHYDAADDWDGVNPYKDEK